MKIIACPYYDGYTKEKKKFHLHCGEDFILEYEEQPALDEKLKMCEFGQYEQCRAFLVQSLKDKKINLPYSEMNIDQLQESYQRCKNLKGCKDCENYWYSAGYRHLNVANAWGPDTKIPCEAMTHYCRPGGGQLIAIHPRNCCQMDRCKEYLQKTIQEEKTMNEYQVAAIEKEEITDAYEQAQTLHREIMVNGNLAANAFFEFCRGLKKMRDTKLYTELGYEDFDSYVEGAVNIKKRQAYTYISTLEALGSDVLKENASLGITKLALLASVPPTQREEFMQEHDLSGVSTREMKELTEKYTKAQEQISFLTMELSKAQEEAVNAEDIETLEEEKAQLLQQKKWLEQKLCAAEENLGKLRQDLEAEKARPVDVAVMEPDQETLQKIKDEAVNRAFEQAQKEIAAAREKAQAEKREMEAQMQKEIEAAKARAKEEYRESLSEIEKRAAEASDRAKELEKKLSIVGNSDTLAFNIHFEELSANFNKLLGLLIKILASDADTAVKLQGAMRKYISLMDEKISGAI